MTTIKAGAHGVEAMVAYYAGLAADQASRDGACRGPVDYYLAADEPPGRWWGEGTAALGLGAEVAPEELEALLTARHPGSGGRLGRGFGADSARAFDACFSAPKSVSVLWGLAEDPFVRAEAAAAHDAAVEAALSFFARHGSVTRRGTDGVDQVDTRGLSVALFRQHTSRSSDPQLHTHAIVVAKVQDDSGKWLSLDARFLKRQQCSIGWVYAGALRSELTARLGVGWGAVSNGHADIEGVPAEALRVFSARAAQVKQRLGELVARWVEDHDGAEPDPRTLYRLERWAAVDSRPAKHAVGDPEALRADWRAQAATAGVAALDVVAAAPGLPGLDGIDRPGIIAEALARVAAESSTWLHADLSRHIATLLPAGAAASGAGAVALVEELTALAAGQCVELQPEAPAGVPRRRDGRPVSEAVTERHLTTTAVLDQETCLLGWAAGAATGPGPLPDGDDAQAAVAEAVAGAGRLVLVVGPAGTGKTTALGTAARSLAAQGRPVVGLAPSGKAADVLGAETGWPATTLAKLLTDAGRPGYRPPPGTTVVLDESGMAATDDLDVLVGLVGRHGWRLVCVGDPAQLPAVGRGGMFELWCERVGAHTLEEVRRFDEPWQAEASLALRRGERSAAAAYAAHGRLDAVHPALLPERLARVHLLRSQAGRSLAITTASAGMARDINLAIQRRHNSGRAGPSVALADGSAAFAGDVVATRRNDPTRTDTGQAVRNRHTWEVEAVGADGSLVVSHPTRGRARLPATYVSRHVELGWAVTGYGTQGDTTDDGICVLEPSSTRSGVYVGMTRGRGQNLGLVVDPTGMADPEEAFAAVIARPANARTALAVRDRLADDRAVTPPATGLPAPAMTTSVPGAGSQTAGPVEPCPPGPDAAGAPAPAAATVPGAPPPAPAESQDDDDLVARMRRRLGQVERQRPLHRARRR
ncbi:MAG TPA: MobF family relaxase [Acidimicrobiales bacterium]|nr:MobF family relaxase [Acidimicrobiales bacterium]